MHPGVVARQRVGEFRIVERSGIPAAMDDPDVVLAVDVHANCLTEHPVVLHRLGPQRIDLKPRRLLGIALSRGLAQNELTGSERREYSDETDANQLTTV